MYNNNKQCMQLFDFFIDAAEKKYHFTVLMSPYVIKG